MLVTSTPPKPAAASVSSSAVRFVLSTALPIHHQRVQGLVSEVVSGHFRSGACPTATWARSKTGKSVRASGVISSQRENEDTVPHARRLVVARRLERDPRGVIADHRIRRLVALVVTPAREPDEIGTVRLERQLPDVNEARVLP